MIPSVPPRHRRINFRNAFPQDRNVSRNRDFFNGNFLTPMRTVARQFILACEVDL